MYMKDLDGRKLKRDTLEELRFRAIKRVEDGESPEVVIKSLGLHRASIYRWIAAYKKDGEKGLTVKTAPGKEPKLNKRQLLWLYNTIKDKNPLQLKFQFALWTREMVQKLIKDKYDISISLATVGRVLAKLGFTFQKPINRAYQQDESLVKHWVEKEFPKIQQEAKIQRADIFFADEAGVKSDYHSGKTWGVRGKTPIVKTTGARFGVNVISAISPRGQMNFMTIKGRMASDQFNNFLKRLMHNRKRKVFLIVDGLPTHKSKKVKAFVDTYKGKLKLIYLPPYSPELNPDELVWNNLKNKIGRAMITGPDQLKSLVVKFLRGMQRSPLYVASLFYQKDVKYASHYVA